MLKNEVYINYSKYVVKHKIACQHCGTMIKNVYLIRNLNKQTFRVGSECVKLLCSQKNVKQQNLFKK